MTRETAQETTTPVEPVRKTVTVPVTPDAAFRRFTGEMGAWWPRSTHSVSGEECREVVMEERLGGRVYEVDAGGREIEWGAVTAWDPPAHVVFTWHPGRAAETEQEVDVTFEKTENGTRVRLVHRGWEKLGEDAAETRDRYAGGWDLVLGRYVETAQGA